MKSQTVQATNVKSSNRLRNPLKSIGLKLFLILIASTLFFVLLVGYSSYRLSSSVIKDKVAQSSQQTIAQAAGKMDLMLQGYDDLSLQIFLDPDVISSIEKMNTGKDAYAKLEANRNLDKKMQSFVFSNKTIAAIHFEGINNGIKYSTSGGIGEEVKKKPWYADTLKQSGRIVWLETEHKGYSGIANQPTIGLARVLKNATSNEGEHLLVIEIYLKGFLEELNSINSGEGSVVRMLNANNVILASTIPEELSKPSEIPLTVEKDKKLGSFTYNGNQVVFSQFKKTSWKLASYIPEKELLKDTKKIWDNTLIIALIAIVVACGVGYFLARYVGGPLVELNRLMRSGEQGNLTVRTKIRRNDEIGELGRSFNQMMDKITELVKQTNQSAKSVLQTANDLTAASNTTAVSSREISIATEEIANGASSLAVEAERGNDITFNISSQMKAVIDSNLQMGNSATEVQKVSEQGTLYMTDLISKTSATEEMTRSMVEKVENLKTSTQSIRKILDVLNNMTKQTNILSLNATIEASRAGAAGKGFMVVADEIRNLAEQSKRSIEVVGQITDTVQREIDETVEVLSTAYPLFQAQIHSVKEANQIFTTVNNQMSGFIISLDNATGSIQQLNQTQSILSEAMANVSAVAEESSATSEEVASLSSEQLSIGEGLVRLSGQLENVSAQLKETLNKFTIE